MLKLLMIRPGESYADNNNEEAMGLQCHRTLHRIHRGIIYLALDSEIPKEFSKQSGTTFAACDVSTCKERKS
jgi:hypothetical protein